MRKLVELCRKTYDSENWSDESEQALESLFGSDGGRYSLQSQKEIQLRTPKATVPFGTILH